MSINCDRLGTIRKIKKITWACHLFIGFLIEAMTMHGSLFHYFVFNISLLEAGLSLLKILEREIRLQPWNTILANILVLSSWDLVLSTLIQTSHTWTDTDKNFSRSLRTLGKRNHQNSQWRKRTCQSEFGSELVVTKNCGSETSEQVRRLCWSHTIPIFHSHTSTSTCLNHRQQNLNGAFWSRFYIVSLYLSYLDFQVFKSFFYSRADHETWHVWLHRRLTI